MSTQIAIAVAPNAAYPGVSGGGVWGAGRFWPVGTTVVTLVPNAWYEPEYFAMVAYQVQFGMTSDNLCPPSKLQPRDPAVIAAMAAGGGGIAPIDIAPSTAAPGTFEDTTTRTTIGQRAYQTLLTCPLLAVAVLP